MPITIIVEDGSIVTGANSYISLTDATDFLSYDIRYGPIWESLDVETQNKLLVMATRYLDDNFQWYGKRTDRVTPQDLDWPRCGMIDGDGCYIADTVIPKELKDAESYLAVWMYENDPNQAMESEGVKRFRTEDIEIEWQDGYNGRFAPEFLSKLLRPFGTGPNDRGFKKIVKR